MDVMWPSDFVVHEDTVTELDPDTGAQLFKGVRVRMGFTMRSADAEDRKVCCGAEDMG